LKVNREGRREQAESYQENTGVVVHMQETELLPSLFSNDEKGIQKVKNFGEVKHVQDKTNGVVDGINWVARDQSVSSEVGTDTSFNTHVRAKHNLNNIVSKLKWVESLHAWQKWHNNLRSTIEQ
jgi:hypothetical protein